VGDQQQQHTQCSPTHWSQGKVEFEQTYPYLRGREVASNRPLAQGKTVHKRSNGSKSITRHFEQ